jgi:peptide/nickel transport system permease protein
VAILAPLIAPHDPYAQSLQDRFLGPSWSHPLGTDDFGRDVLSRLIYATRIAIVAPVVAVGLALLLGLPSGLFAGYRKGPIAAILARLAETLMSIPAIVAAIAIISVLGPGLARAMLAIGIVFAPGVFRVVRGAGLSVTEETYILSSQAIGSSTRRVVWVHCLPNVLAPLLVQISLLMGFALLAESSLSFLGLGVQLPEASWGSMLRSASQNQFNAPYAVIPPGVALTLTILALNTLGDVIRDAISDRGAG